MPLSDSTELPHKVRRDMRSHHTARMKKNKLEVYELADVPVAFIEQVAQNVLELINTRMEADNADDYRRNATRSPDRAPSDATCALFPCITVRP